MIFFKKQEEQRQTDTLNRRHFIALGAGALSIASTQKLYAAEELPTPREIGRKFDIDGRVRAFAGNTIICHLEQQNGGYDVFNNFLDFYRNLPTLDFSSKIAALPPSSYHMTVFGGANDQSRQLNLWPSDVSLQAPMDECNEHFYEKLKSFHTRLQTPIRMVIDDRRFVGAPATIGLKPENSIEASRLKDIRKRLADLLKIGPEKIDHYRFHVTLAYQTKELTREEFSSYMSYMHTFIGSLKKNVPVISFGSPEFCTFQDMYSFRRKFFLRA